MFRTIDDFQRHWGYESKSTLKIFNSLSDESLGQRVTPDGRSLGDLAWHITTTLNEMPGQAGLQVDAPEHGLPAPATAAEIVAAYERAAASFAEAVGQNWNDEGLAESIPMYGQSWTRGETLTALSGHQAHHRAQMTVLMRQAGLTVPGVYGPAREEWAAFGMEAMP
jgi:uncharacterized damage-inducible protein DinB